MKGYLNYMRESNIKFWDNLIDHFEKFKYRPKYIILFYLDYPTLKIRKLFKNKLINLHPSILPAFKGFDVDYQTEHIKPKIVGSTVEIVRHRMDNGLILAQSADTYNPKDNFKDVRHSIYLQQISLLLQLIRWIEKDLIVIEDDFCYIKDSKYNSTNPFFSPNLDKDIIEEIYG